jgi:hypothetical protein
MSESDQRAGDFRLPDGKVALHQNTCVDGLKRKGSSSRSTMANMRAPAAKSSTVENGGGRVLRAGGDYRRRRGRRTESTAAG